MATTQRNETSRTKKTTRSPIKKAKRRVKEVTGAAKNKATEKVMAKRPYVRGLEGMSAKSIFAIALGIGAIGVGAMVYANKRKNNDEMDDVNASTDENQYRAKDKKYGKGSRDKVEEASWESFPASDAPGNY